jgi:hypothetical protein
MKLKKNLQNTSIGIIDILTVLLLVNYHQMLTLLRLVEG